ncbi:MAG: hypothetical protein IT439_10305 [Phycisphaerales bacterium]|nr:hypothetical protein [Phycisphaerales bacterium]
MSPAGVVVFVVAIVAVDAAVLWVVFRYCSRMWRSLALRFPPTDPAPDAVYKRRQSFRVNFMNLSRCVDVAVDEQALHLRPVRFARWFGVTACSVPWEHVRVKKVGRWWGVAVVGAATIAGPAWCLRLAPAQGGDAHSA